MKSIVEQVFEHALRMPEKVALTDGKKIISFHDLVCQILYTKKLLTNKYDIKKGDKVIISASKQLTFVPVYLACHLLSATALPIAPDTNLQRFNSICNKVFPKLIVGFDADNTSCAKVPLSEFVVENYFVDDEDIVFPDEGALADIIFTTGTTGEPKGVQLTQKNIAAAAANINAFIQNSSEDVEMLALPISHSFGLGRLRCALSNGQTVVILGSFANIKRFFRYMEEFHITGFGMVPSSWAMLKKLSGTKIKDYAKQLHYIEIGSAPMSIDDKKLLIDILPKTRICMHYGLTEASRSCFMELHESIAWLDTIGKPSPNIHVEIMDEAGKIVPEGTEGEICVSGDAVTVGYLISAIDNKDYFWGEFLRTGDWGVKDSNGRIKLSARKRELINVGGKKVSPNEVEDFLNSIDFVKESVCIGIPDSSGVLGEVVKAYIVTDHPEQVCIENIRKICRGRLEDYKIPSECQVIDSIPKTSSGKICRVSLKEHR